MITWSVLVWDSFWCGIGYALGASAVFIVPLILLGAWAYCSDEWRAWLKEGWFVADFSWKRQHQSPGQDAGATQGAGRPAGGFDPDPED